MLVFALCAPAHAQKPAERKVAAFETSASQAILFDATSRTVLFELEADTPIPPASLAKLMTATLVFRELREDRFRLDHDFIVSVNAWRKGGAVSNNPNMLLTPNKVVKLGELLSGLIIGGANDAALALAENIAGRESRFVEMMNEHAQELGLKSMVFVNPTGLTAEGQAASLRDLVKLAAHIITEYPEYYGYFAQKDMALGQRTQRLINRNPLLTMEIGADGLMTGFLPDSGYSVIGSAVQDGRRLIVGLAGLETLQERATETRKILEWGFRRFEIKSLYADGMIVGDVSLYGGQDGSVPVKTATEIRLPLLRGSNDGSIIRLSYRGPVAAPVKEGAEIARLQVLIDGRVIQDTPLVAAKSVEKGGVIALARDAASEVSRQWVTSGFDWFSQMSQARKKKAEGAAQAQTAPPMHTVPPPPPKKAP